MGSSRGAKRKEENDNKNNKGQQLTTKKRVPRMARKKMLSKVVISCLGCRKKENDNRNNNKQQWTTKHRQSTPAVIAEASRNAFIAEGRTNLFAMLRRKKHLRSKHSRDTERGALRRLLSAISRRKRHEVSSQGSERRKRQHKQQGTTNGVLA